MCPKSYSVTWKPFHVPTTFVKIKLLKTNALTFKHIYFIINKKAILCIPYRNNAIYLF